MKFSRRWLGDYLDLPPGDELPTRLTAAGFAVELAEEGPAGDTVYDIDLTSNRPDAMCHLGLAREAAVVLGTALRPPVVTLDEGTERAADVVRIEIADADLCARFVGRVVRGVKVGPSPPWLAERLQAIGLRSISNVVDVTNFVLWELGQPLHAYDLAKLAGARLVARRASAGETIKTLDGAERKLDPEMLVIADDAGPVGIGGVMGGFDSEVTAATTDIVIEGAWFAPASVRRTSKKVGLHTDASHRFERGVDPELQAHGVARAAALIAEVAGGTVLAGAVDVVARRLELPTIPLDLDRLDRFAGTPIPEEQVIRWFDGLGCRLAPTAPRRYAVSIPSWRLGDLVEPADLHEEALRLFGFDQVPSTLPAVLRPDGPTTPRQHLRRVLRRALAASGYAEAINLAFHEAEGAVTYPALGFLEARPEATVRLANPLSETTSTLRPTLLAGLVSSARFNTRRQAGSVRLFEIGGCFAWGSAGAVVEREAIALVAGGRVGSPWDGAGAIDFFDLKGTVEALAQAAGVAIEAFPAEAQGFVPGACAELRIAGRRAGVMGQLQDDGGYPLFAAELALDALELPAEARLSSLKVVPPPRVPGIEVDLTLTHATAVPWHDLAAAITAEGVPELVRFGLKDRYQGQGVPSGAVNTTITFLYHAGERQLTQEEVNGWQEALTAKLAERFAWTS